VKKKAKEELLKLADKIGADEAVDHLRQLQASKTEGEIRERQAEEHGSD
jgi:hypothetical protein